MRTIAGSVCVSLIVGGCVAQPTSQTANLITVQSVTPKILSLDEAKKLAAQPDQYPVAKAKAAIASLRKNASTLADTYLKSAQDDQRIAQYYDYPLIGAAAAAVAALFYRASIDTVGGIGIGAGTITVLKEYAKPTEKEQAYAAARKMLMCAYNASAILETSNPTRLQTAESDLEEAIQAARERADNLPSGSGGSAITQAQNNLSTALQAAEAVRSALDTEIGSLLLAPEALSNIIDQAQSTVLDANNSTVSFSSAYDTISSNLQTATHSQTTIQAARDQLFQAKANQSASAQQVAQTASQSGDKNAQQQARRAQPTVDATNATINKLLTVANAANDAIITPPYSAVLAKINACQLAASR